MLGSAGLVLAYAILAADQRVRFELYYYQLFVRMQTPGASGELLVPVPNFFELRELIWVDWNFTDFPNRNVTRSIVESVHGTMFRFAFSDSFAAWGAIQVSPGSANGTLTFSSQVSNAIWIFLSNVSVGNQVSIILLYQVSQVRGFLSKDQEFFLGTADPREGRSIGQHLRCGYVLEMIRDDKAYTALSGDWGLYPLADGGFTTKCD